MKLLIIAASLLAVTSFAFAAADRERCGTIAGITCDEGRYCDTGIGSCATADAEGVCQAKPKVCTEQYMPVCGCDHKTYGNACEAAAAGVVISSKGECKDKKKS